MEQAARQVELSFHPVCTIFPLMADGELDALAADIRAHGLREPIVVTGDTILDGRNRWLACRKIGERPRTVQWQGNGSLLDFVISANLHRRHLSTSQRSLVAGRIATMKSGERTDLQSNDSRSSGGTISAEDAAFRVAVSLPSVFRAKRVLADGTADEVRAIEEGRVTVNAVVRKIWERKRDQTKQTAEIIPLPVLKRRKQGPPAKMPAGMKRSEVAAKAVELRHQLASSDAVAAALGMQRVPCGQLIDIMLISQRQDLSPRDMAVAARARDSLDDLQIPLSALHHSLEPIADRLWGKQRGGRWSRAGLEANRLERFERGFGILVQACKNGSKIEIPHLSPEKARSVVAELKESVAHVKTLMERIERIHK